MCVRLVRRQELGEHRSRTRVMMNMLIYHPVWHKFSKVLYIGTFI